MDQSLLVNVGQNLLTYLDREGVEVDAAVWIFDPEAQWRLWLAPRAYVDRRSFYMTLAQVLSKHRLQIGDLDIADVQVLEPGNPLIGELRRFHSPTGSTFPILLTSARLGGQYLPEGICVGAVRLLFDANLSPRLAALLRDVFPGSAHVSDVGHLAADDLTIWNHARDNGFTS